jgi:hypothetical protein
MVIEKAE